MSITHLLFDKNDDYRFLLLLKCERTIRPQHYHGENRGSKRIVLPACPLNTFKTYKKCIGCLGRYGILDLYDLFATMIFPNNDVFLVFCVSHKNILYIMIYPLYQERQTEWSIGTRPLNNNWTWVRMKTGADVEIQEYNVVPILDSKAAVSWVRQRTVVEYYNRFSRQPHLFVQERRSNTMA